MDRRLKSTCGTPATSKGLTKHLKTMLHTLALALSVSPCHKSGDDRIA